MLRSWINLFKRLSNRTGITRAPTPELTSLDTPEVYSLTSSAARKSGSKFVEDLEAPESSSASTTHNKPDRPHNSYVDDNTILRSPPPPYPPPKPDHSHLPPRQCQPSSHPSTPPPPPSPPQPNIPLVSLIILLIVFYPKSTSPRAQTSNPPRYLTSAAREIPQHTTPPAPSLARPHTSQTTHLRRLVRLACRVAGWRGVGEIVRIVRWIGLLLVLNVATRVVVVMEGRGRRWYGVVEEGRECWWW